MSDCVDEPDEARFERLRDNRLTVEDARLFLAENEAAAKPCPDFSAFLREFIAAAESAR